MTLPALYDDVAAYVQPGGHVIVSGYPNLVEEPERWGPWRQRFLFSCQNISETDARMLESAAGYLDPQIALAVQDADRRWAPQGVHFDYIDVATKVFETDSGRHGLCSEDPWINGLSSGVTDGDRRFERSYHPNQQGHDGIGQYLASLIGSAFSFEPPSSPISFATRHCLSGAPRSLRGRATNRSR